MVHIAFSEDVDVPTICAFDRVRWPCHTSVALKEADRWQQLSTLQAEKIKELLETIALLQDDDD